MSRNRLSVVQKSQSKASHGRNWFVEELGESPEYKPRSYDGRGKRNFRAKGRNTNKGSGNAPKKGDASKGRGNAPRKSANPSGKSNK